MLTTTALASALLVAALVQEEAASSRPVELVLDPASTIELEAFWEPCRTSTYGLFDETPALRSPEPDVPRRTYEGEWFLPFLPTGPVRVGDVWRCEAEAVLSFLDQFDPGAMLRGHFHGGEVPGTWAALRAVSDEAFEVVLRAHAVFELEDRVIYKPAQFEGRLVVSRPAGEVLWFSLALPSRDTNVDVNVPVKGRSPDGRETEFISADIGWVPRMELTSGAPAEVAWGVEAPIEEVRLTLRRSFYSFATLDWLPFEEAVLESRRTGKPLHLVALFGALDDDSC